MGCCGLPPQESLAIRSVLAGRNGDTGSGLWKALAVSRPCFALLVLLLLQQGRHSTARIAGFQRRLKSSTD